MIGPVLASKLRPPTPRPEAVERGDLLAKLEHDAERFTVIVAPTGWGKSQLIAQWLATSAANVAYVGLDRWDNDPTRCWTHLLASIADAVSVEVEDLRASLRAPGLPIVSEIVERLMPRLDGHTLRIVLEDFHLITSPEVIESLEAVIDLAPQGIAVVIASRTEPPLHLPRRRVSDALTEIRLDELRMDTAAADLVVSHAVERRLDDDLVRLIVDRTEGWPAGIYLAGLSLRSDPDIRRFVESFAGDNRMISEYLSAEVLAGLDGADRQFLLGTAVLERLDADTCDKLLDTTDAAVRLEHLSRTNLFLIPTDSAGHTYRYHHLFSDWLRLEAQRDDADRYKDAHRRAANIYSSQGDHRLAVDHALAAGSADLAYELVAKSGVGLLDTGHHSTVARWCAQLPEIDDRNRIADLAALRGWMAILDGDLDAVDHHCRIAQAVLHSQAWDSLMGLGDAGEIDLIRSYGLLLGGDFDLAAATAARARSAGVAQMGEATLAYVEGATCYWRGEPDPDRFHVSRSASLDMRDPYAVLLADGHLALIALDNHDLRSATSLIAASFATAQAAGLESFGYAAICHVARAQLRLFEGDPHGALADGQRAAELAPRRSDLPIGCLAGIVLANAQHHLGNEHADETLRTVAADIGTMPNPGILLSKLHIAERQLRIPARARSNQHHVLLEELTEREMRLLQLLPGSLSQRELAGALHVSFNTIKTYNRQIYRKLAVSSRDEAVTAARAVGLL